jgi:hypothetical protein
MLFVLRTEAQKIFNFASAYNDSVQVFPHSFPHKEDNEAVSTTITVIMLSQSAACCCNTESFLFQYKVAEYGREGEYNILKPRYGIHTDLVIRTFYTSQGCIYTSFVTHMCVT